MKYRLRGLNKAIENYKTQRKEFKLPYFEVISISPIIEVADEDVETFNRFFYEFNGFSDNYQIGLETVDEEPLSDRSNKQLSDLWYKFIEDHNGGAIDDGYLFDCLKETEKILRPDLVDIIQRRDSDE